MPMPVTARGTQTILRNSSNVGATGIMPAIERQGAVSAPASTQRVQAAGAVATLGPITLAVNTDGAVTWTPPGSGVRYLGTARVWLTGAPSGSEVWVELSQVSGGGSLGSDGYSKIKSGSSVLAATAVQEVNGGVPAAVTVYWTATGSPSAASLYVKFQATAVSR